MKLNKIYLIIVTLAVVFVSVYNVVLLDRTLTDYHSDKTLFEMKAVENVIESVFEAGVDRAISFSIVASKLAYSELLSAIDADYFDVVENTSVYNMYVGFSNGVYKQSAYFKVPSDYNPTTRPWYKENDRGKQYSLSDVYVDIATGCEVITISSMFVTRDGIEGVVGVDIELSSLSTLLQGISTKSSLAGDVLVLDASMNTISSLQIGKYTNADGRQLLNSNKSTLSVSGLNWTIHFLDTSKSAVQKEAYRNYALTFLMIVVVIYVLIKQHITNTKNSDLQAELLSVNKALEKMSCTDSLTGIPNRHYYEKRVRELWDMCLLECLDLGIILIDIDNFKEYNDTYGHTAGDAALREVARTLGTFSGSNVEVYRYGGEEFIVTAYGMRSSDVVDLAENLRFSVEALEIQQTTSVFKSITISVGVHTGNPCSTSTLGMFVNSADRLLYKAKANGRNRVES